jgi:hypothetical protein
MSCRFISAEKDLDQAVTVPGFSEEREEKDDDSKSRRTVSTCQIKISVSFYWKYYRVNLNLLPQHNCCLYELYYM